MTRRFYRLLCPRPGRALIVLSATLILATGCAALTPADHGAPLAEGPARTAGRERAAAPPPATEACQVEVRSKTGKSLVRKVALTGEQHVTDALAETGALHKYGNCEVAVLRPQANGSIAKMNVNLSPNKRQVRAETDYFLYPGDRVVVREVDTTPAEEMMGGMFGSLAPRKK